MRAVAAAVNAADMVVQLASLAIRLTPTFAAVQIGGYSLRCYELKLRFFMDLLSAWEPAVILRMSLHGYKS